MDGAYVQETELWLREIVPNAEYQSGSILSPVTFVDEDPDLLHRVFQAVSLPAATPQTVKRRMAL